MLGEAKSVAKKSTKQRLQKIFPVLARDLAEVENAKGGDRIRCPLCLSYFGREAIEDERLTEEHIIPESVGGRLTTITCQRCNNSHGTRLDPHLTAAAKAIEVLSGSREITSRVHIGNSSFTAEVILNPDPSVINEVVVIEKASDPRQVKEAMAALRTGAHEMRFVFPLGYNDTRLWLALLKVVYLYSFRRSGYSYVLSPQVQELRRQIQGDDPPNDLLSSLITSVPIDKPFPLPAFQFDLWPQFRLPACLTLLQTRLKRVVTYSVLTPSAATRPAGSIEQLAEVSRSLRGRKIEFTFW